MAATTYRVNFISVLILAVAGGILYAKTLHVPWLMDDLQNIIENPVVHDLGLALRRVGEPRGVAYLSFAFNYRFGGLNLSYFHLTNIAIHIATAWTVFLIFRRIFRESFWLPLAGGLIFLAHPLQTQAVNYVVQRMASLCGFFFFLALYLYMVAREKGGQAEKPTAAPFLLYCLSLASCIAALWTKQNAVVLPLALLLVDRFFLTEGRGMWKRTLLWLLPFFLVTLLNASQQVGGGKVILKEAGKAQFWAQAKQTSAAAKLAPNAVTLVRPPENLQALYLATEMPVLWLYLRLLVLPVNQTFDYGYPLAASVLELRNVAAFAGHIVLLAVAVFLCRRRPLISFGILWFYLSLAVESSIIPLDAAVEHRLYMTMFGFALVVLDVVRMIPKRGAAAVAGTVVIGLLMLLTWQRNAVWGDAVAFAEDNVRKAPFNQRGYLTLATAHADRGAWVEAEKTLRKAITLRPDYSVAYENLGSALVQQGRLMEALPWYQMALNLSPDNAKIMYNAGLVLIRMGDLAGARSIAGKIMRLDAELGQQFSLFIKGADPGGK